MRCLLRYPEVRASSASLEGCVAARRAVVLRDALRPPQDDGDRFEYAALANYLRRADLAEELGDLTAELLALGFQRLGSLLDVVGGSGRRIGVGLYAGDVLGNVLGALGCK